MIGVNLDRRTLLLNHSSTMIALKGKLDSVKKGLKIHMSIKWIFANPFLNMEFSKD